MKIRILSAVLSAVLAAACALAPLSLGAQPQKRGEVPSASLPQSFLAGYDAGLYRIEGGGERAVPLWLDAEVRKIIRSSAGWYFLSSLGVVYSSDLGVFEDRSAGLPAKTYKRVENGRKSFSTETQDLKDLEVDAADPLLLATCTKDAVFVTRDGGKSWKSFGSPVENITGLKAVGLAPYPGTGEAAVWASHPIKGLFVRKLASGGWAPANGGLAMIRGTTSVEEVADLVPGRDGSVWASDSFLPRVYRMEPKSKAFVPVWTQNADFGCAESLDPLPDGSLRFVADGNISRWSPATGRAESDEAAQMVARAAERAKPDWQNLCISWSEGGRQSSLSELWLLSFKDRKPYRAQAENKRALYLPTGFVVNPTSRGKYDLVMDSRRLDAIVVDMKDDFGRLRFDPRDPLVRKIGKMSNPLDIETFAREWKAKGRYLIARIPVFKDEIAYKFEGGRFAVRDAGTGGVWQGYNLSKAQAVVDLAPVLDGAAIGPLPQSAAATPLDEKTPIAEFWVDPYCEEIWAYNVAIGNEMIARGFDEVQFDYIRFPTDGANINQASFSWKDQGMDKETALASFLRFARENIAAPISIDIYGANGWYRSGVRTGQDVELMARYVDVICPMLYPSHFEQGFLAQDPAVDRPYRIYKIGALRNAYIARKKVVVRPYVQAFFLNVKYDRAFYGPDYVKREIAGVRDSVNLGLTFWNNSGRYDDLPVLEIGPDGRLALDRPLAAPSQKMLD